MTAARQRPLARRVRRRAARPLSLHGRRRGSITSCRGAHDFARRVDPDDIASAALVGAELIAEAANARARRRRAAAARDGRKQLRRRAGRRRRCKRIALDEDAGGDRAALSRPRASRRRIRARARASSSIARARASRAWYELFPRSTRAEPGRARHASRRARRACRTSPSWASTCSTCRRSIRSAATQAQGHEQRARRRRRTTSAARGRSAPSEGGHKAIHPAARHARRLPRACVAARARARHRDRARHRVPVRARPSVRERASGVVPLAARRHDPVRREPAEEVPGHLSVRLRVARTGAALWDELRERVRVLDRRRACASSASTIRTPSRFAFWEWVIGEIKREHPGRDLPRRGVHAAEGHAPAGEARLHAVVHLLHLAQHQAGADRVLHRARARTRRANTSGRTVWPNTPDILPEYLQHGGRPAFIARLVLAATLAAQLRHLRPGVRAARSTCRASPAARSISTRRSTRSARWDLERAGQPAPSHRARERASAARTRRCSDDGSAALSSTIDNDAAASRTSKATRGPRQRAARGRQPRPAPRAERAGSTLDLDALGARRRHAVPGARPADRRALPVARARATTSSSIPRACRRTSSRRAAACAPSAISTTSYEARWTTATVDAAATAARRRGAARTIRSGTRTRSSTSCTSRRSSTERRRHRRLRGLTQKLDYIQDLGVNAIWLLPFYPSPLHDDGYDIADYHNVHPDYGTLADFRALPARGAPRAACGSSPSWSSTTPPTSTRGSRRRGARRRARRSATSTCGATTDTSTPARASSSPTPRRRTGRGTRSPSSTTGTASSATSRT